MARVKLLSAIVYDVGTYEAQGAADPVLKVLGELPGTAKPFAVHRVYQGSQGRYEESMLLLDPDDVVLWQAPYRFIQLRGQMYEDLFRSTIDDDVKIDTPGEHHLVFLIDDQEAGRVPVFIDAPESARSAGVIDAAAETALKKGSVVWLHIPQPDGSLATRPAWYVQEGLKLYVLTGPGEQDLPNLGEVSEVQVTLKSKDVHASIAQARGQVRRVDPASDEFERIATLGMGTRLNLPDGDAALTRWRDTCLMAEISLQIV